ncbi:hypothetical protein [Sphingopyxis sp. NJF-3]
MIQKYTAGRFFRIGRWTVFINQHWWSAKLRTHLPRRDVNQEHIVLWNTLILGVEISWWRPA